MIAEVARIPETSTLVSSALTDAGVERPSKGAFSHRLVINDEPRRQFAQWNANGSSFEFLVARLTRATCFAQLTHDVSMVPVRLARVRQIWVEEHQMSHDADGSTGPLGR